MTPIRRIIRHPRQDRGRLPLARPKLVLVVALLTSLVGVGAATGAIPQRDRTGDAARAGRVVVVRAAGDIRAAVDRYRSLLGPDNGGAPGGQAQGRREINWDSVPDQFAEPNALPGDFFNAPTAPPARGALLTTPGNHVAVSAAPNNPSGTAVRFGDINPTYPSRFQTFSPPRLFSPIGSNIVNLFF